MEASEVAAAAVAVVAAAITGTASTVGEQTGAAIAQVVRDRLGASSRGRTALADLEESDGSPESQAAASAVLAEEVGSDPQLYRALTVRLNEPSVTDGVHIDRSRIRGDAPILVGNGTLNFTKPTSAAGMVALALAVLVVVGVIALAIYGSKQVLTDDSPPSSHGPTAATPDARGNSATDGTSGQATIEPRALSESEVATVVPDLEDMPAGWTSFSKRNGFRPEETKRCTRGTAIYEYPERNGGSLQAAYITSSCADFPSVVTFYDEGLRYFKQEHPEATHISMPPCGDKSTAITFDRTGPIPSENGKYVRMQSLVGAVYLQLSYGPIDNGADTMDSLDRLQGFISEFCDRALASQTAG
ncbi:hypothetical protein ACF08M_35400 [Streptomyces sp. NPDC015032]|uniref:hypothetical protein n=1 Tax=Streptomyces sp. NPDC015032 TaxID=3364937 RepID=UPI0036F80C60